MPQLDKFTFFTQLFWFFLFFFSFFVLLLKSVLPSIARSLKFRRKILKHYKATLDSYQTEDLIKKDSSLAATSLTLSKNFAVHVQNFSKIISTKNVLVFSRSRYFLTTFLFYLQNKKLQKRLVRRRSHLIKVLSKKLSASSKRVIRAAEKTTKKTDSPSKTKKKK